MPVFNRPAACLAELSTMDDDTTAHAAGIAFVGDNDHGVLAELREGVANAYRTGRMDGPRPGRDTGTMWRVAGDIGTDVAGRGNQLPRFAAVTDIEYLRLDIGASFDPGIGAVAVDGDVTIEEVVRSTLRTRYAMAAYGLLTHLEDDADDKEDNHEDPGEDPGRA